MSNLRSWTSWHNPRNSQLSKEQIMQLAIQKLSHHTPASFVRSGIAVCYQCSFSSDEGGSSCPECSFPLIMQSELSPPGGIRVSDVLQRESLRRGAPPLPGVHAEPRKAQLLAEARKRIRDTARLTAQAQVGDAQTAAPSKQRSLSGLLSLSFMAVGFGIAAAALQTLL